MTDTTQVPSSGLIHQLEDQIAELRATNTRQVTRIQDQRNEIIRLTQLLEAKERALDVYIGNRKSFGTKPTQVLCDEARRLYRDDYEMDVIAARLAMNGGRVSQAISNQIFAEPGVPARHRPKPKAKL